MELLKSFASSFRSINRMGDQQSTQAASEQDESETAPKPWHPSDASESSDAGDTISIRYPTLPAKPESLSGSTRKGRGKRKKKNKKEKSKSTSATDTAPVNGSHQGANDSLSAHHATTQQEPRSDSSDLVEKRNDSEQEVTDEANGLDANEPLAETVPQEEVDDQEERHNTSTTSLRSLRIRPMTVKERRACPLANAYGCNETFSSEDAAQRHAQTHSPRPSNQCRICHKIFSRPYHLDRHKLIHAREETRRNGSVLKSTDKESTEDQETQEEPETLLNGTERLPDHVSAGIASESTETVEQSSIQRTASSTSVFSEPIPTDIVEETPRPKSRLKRKRDTGGSDRPGDSLTATSRKRRRRHSLSPPTSAASDVEEENGSKKQDERKSNAIQILLPKIEKAKITRPGNLDNFARRWTPGSQLHHPIHNPRSPRAPSGQFSQVVVPRSSRAGPSTTKATSHVERTFSTQPSRDSDGDQTPLAGKLRRATYTAPKGKQKAENGVIYSSPPARKVSTEKSELIQPSGMATTVARRGASILAGSKRPRVDDGDSEDDLSSERNDVTNENADEGQTSSAPFTCQECNQTFTTRSGLQKHKQDPNVHIEFHECDSCSRKFPSVTALKAHHKKSGHGDDSGEEGRKGRFSASEIRKLEKWRANFCEDYNIDIATFGQMMTDSGRRTKGDQWPYRSIPKAEFLKQYYDVLPGRERRSMRRFRERAFQNVPQKQEWTEEDDEELRQLVQELGQKWVEIGQRMTRTQDSVSQRWRFKLQYLGIANQGEWLDREENKLKRAVAEVQEELGLPSDPYAVNQLPWSTVSAKLKGTRTPQQCSNKWRLMHNRREGNTFVKPSETAVKSRGPSATETPSKISQRLAGQTPSTTKSIIGSSSRKKPVSNERVQDSDEDEDESDGDRQSQPDEQAKSDNDSVSSESSSIRYVDKSVPDFSSTEDQAVFNADLPDTVTPAARRKFLSSRTPQTGKGLSQVFAQTQANTSALRSAGTSRKTQTQPEMPTPGIPIQHRRNSSLWQAINTDQSPAKDDNVSISEDELSATKEAEDEIMADAASLDGETQSIQDSVGEPIEREASETSDSESSSESEVSDRNSNRSESSSFIAKPLESGSEESEDDSMVKSTQKDMFVQSLKYVGSQGVRSPTSNTSSRKGSHRQSNHWQRVVAGEPLSQDDSDSDSGDEGDINHH